MNRIGWWLAIMILGLAAGFPEASRLARAADAESAAGLRTQIAEQDAKLADLRQRLRQAEEQQHKLELTEDRLIRHQTQLGEAPVLQARLVTVRAELQEARQAMAGLEQERKAVEGRLAALRSALRQQDADVARRTKEAQRQEAARKVNEAPKTSSAGSKKFDKYRTSEPSQINVLKPKEKNYTEEQRKAIQLFNEM